jgi:hypothetical protein
MDTPPDAGILLTGAVCITMHPLSEGTKLIASTSGASNATVGGGSAIGTPVSGPAGSGAPGGGGAAPATPASSPTTGWAMWLFDLFFKK